MHYEGMSKTKRTFLRIANLKEKKKTADRYYLRGPDTASRYVLYITPHDMTRENNTQHDMTVIRDDA